MAAEPLPPKPQRDWNGRAIALISLVIALASLGYNTWRNETTELHRNARQAAFMMLDQLAQFQQIVDTRYYANERSEMNRIAAWGKAGLLRDLGPLVSERVGEQAQQAFRVWSEHSAALDTSDKNAEAAISEASKMLREETLKELRALQ